MNEFHIHESSESIYDSSLKSIVLRQLHPNAIPYKDPDSILSYFTRQGTFYFVKICYLDGKFTL